MNLSIKSMLALVGIGAGLTWYYFKREAEIATLTPTQRAAEQGAAVVVAAQALRARGIAIPLGSSSSGLVKARVVSAGTLTIDLQVEDPKYPGADGAFVKGFPRTGVEGVIG